MKTSPIDLAFKDRFKNLSQKELSEKAIYKKDYVPPAAISRENGHFLKAVHQISKKSKPEFKDVYFFDTSAKTPKWKAAKILKRTEDGIITIKYEVTKTDAINTDEKSGNKFYRSSEVYFKNPLLLSASGAKYYKANPEKYLENSKPVKAQDRASIVEGNVNHFFRKDDVVYQYDSASGKFKQGKVILVNIKEEGITDGIARMLTGSSAVHTPEVQVAFKDGTKLLEQRNPSLMRASTYDLYGFFSQASRAEKAIGTSKPLSASQRSADYVSKNDKVMFFDYNPKGSGRWVEGKVLSNEDGVVSIAKAKGRREYLSFNLADQGFISIKDWNYLAAPQNKKASLAAWLASDKPKVQKSQASRKPGDFTSSTTVIPGGVKNSQNKLKNLTFRSPMNG